MSIKIQFKKAAAEHIHTIFSWLDEPHMREFWDNSPEHREDILNFVHERKQTYFYGTTVYWVGAIEGEPFCFVLSDAYEIGQKLSDVHRHYMSQTGHTIGLDFGIGNKKYLGKGLAAPTLAAFMSFYKEAVDPLTNTFFIDPDEGNPRALHVYAKAGFERVGEYEVKEGAFVGHVNTLMVKRI